MIQQEAQTICAKLIKQFEGYFSPVFQPTLLEYLSAVEDRLTTFRQQNPKVVCNTAAILFSLGSTLLNNLIQICSRSFLAELYFAKGSLGGYTPEARYQCFVQQHLLPRREQLLSPAAELGQLVSNRVAYSLAAVEELFDRFVKDLNLLEAFLGNSVTSFDDCGFSQGDTHNCGRSVAILTVNGRQKLVYKPHSVENDIIISGLMEWLNQSGRLSAPLRHLRSLSRGEYGWQEFVHHRVCENEGEVEQYMYRLGAVILLAYLTSCCDLHAENIIANGSYPVLVDTETMFSNRYYLGGYHMETVNKWSRYLMHSVFSSGLIPTDILPGKLSESKEIGGILSGINDEQEPIHIQAIIRPGTDEMGYSDVTVPQNTGFHTNLPYLSNRPLHAWDYFDTLSRGFRDAYDAVVTRKEELLELALSGFFDAGVYRQLFRNTELYAKYLRASYHPSYLRDKESRMLVFGKLRGRNDFHSVEHRMLVQSEIHQLLRDDIPYFYTTFTSHALMSADGCVAKEYYQQTIAEVFQGVVQHMDELDCYRQLFFLQNALIRQDKLSARYYPIDSTVFDATEQSSQIAAMTDWIIDLREHYFRIPPGEIEYPMYLANILGKKKVMLQPEPAVLYNGIGSTLFYFQYAAVRKRGHELFRAIFRSVTSPDSPLQTPLLLNGANWRIGVFDGVGSTLYLYLYLYRATGQTDYLRSAEYLCERLIPFAKESRVAWDVIAGHAGVIIFCLNAYHKLPAFSGLRTLAEVCGEMLYTAYCERQIEAQTGFSHGYAGISTALLMLSKETGREEYYTAGMDLLRKESAQYNPALRGWNTSDGQRNGMNAWCHGGPGILIARELARHYVKDTDRRLLEADIEKALYCTEQAVISGDDRPILCHGLPGNLSILQWYAKRTGNLAASKAAAQGFAFLFRSLQSKGILIKDVTNSLQVSFMDGLCGMGYFLLQQLNPDIPSVLALEIP